MSVSHNLAHTTKNGGSLLQWDNTPGMKIGALLQVLVTFYKFQKQLQSIVLLHIETNLIETCTNLLVRY